MLEKSLKRLKVPLSGALSMEFSVKHDQLPEAADSAFLLLQVVMEFPSQTN